MVSMFCFYHASFSHRWKSKPAIDYLFLLVLRKTVFPYCCFVLSISLKTRHPTTTTKSKPRDSNETRWVRVVFENGHPQNLANTTKDVTLGKRVKSIVQYPVIFMSNLIIRPISANFGATRSHPCPTRLHLVSDKSPLRGFFFSLFHPLCTLRPLHLVAISLWAVSATKGPIHQPLSCATVKRKKANNTSLNFICA